ncbi:Phosphoglycolate phosphatase [Pseudovibrio sp. Ad13]|uniref:HAD-IA family hydrolase n=1 Tax=Pseudovibrio sp. Ad13 TaxID=989396 RepID=UPI0007AE3A12|nr:HAD-IA family hydrolase [Pseudovibrio sp. Ad13]KZK83270.1 Phosphoglycolate phosphatase [Pseudovibrio sp. Ad13]
MTDRPTAIFDLDGTLADTIPDLVSAMNRALNKFGVGQVIASEVSYLTGKGGLRSMICHACQLSGASPEKRTVDEIFAASVEDYRLNLICETTLYPGALASLNNFIAEGWLLGVCTNKPVRLAENLLRGLGIDDVFASITGADSFEFKKPDPRHLIRTIEIAGGRPTRAVMVGDTQNDILTAQNANVPLIAVDFGYSESPVEDFGPDSVISEYAALFVEAQKLIN